MRGEVLLRRLSLHWSEISIKDQQRLNKTAFPSLYFNFYTSIYALNVVFFYFF